MRLRVPGPTPVSERVLAASARPMVYHRGPEFMALLQETGALLQPLFGATGSLPFVLAASGTGGLEAALANTICPGDRVLVLDNGHWGPRFGRLAASYGAVLETIESPWGTAPDAEALRRRLAEPDGHEFVAVLAAHNDTFTGAVADLPAIGAAVRDAPALLIVDAVSSLGSMQIETDAWGLDIVVSATQKGLMSPPGLALVQVSEKAWRRIETVEVRGEYWRLLPAREMAAKGQTSFTPSVSLVHALHEALLMIHEVGIQETYARQATMGRALAAGLTELGFGLFPQAAVASPCVGVFKTPAGIDANDVVGAMQRKFGTVIAGARRSRIDGTVIRLGTMGYCQPDDIRLDVHQLSSVLADLGITVDRGQALLRTETILQEGKR